MDSTSNTDNTNVTPPTDGTVNDLGAAAMPVADPSAQPIADAPVEMPTTTEPSVEAPVDAPVEPITGMSEPIADDTAPQPAPIDLPAVAEEAPVADVNAVPGNIPVEPAPTDAPSTPDANQTNGSF